MKELNDVRSESVEDLLRMVYLLQQQVDPVPTTLLAKALDIKAPSVTDMIKRLSESKTHAPLLEHRPYHGVRLTLLGEKIALEVIRHHRLIELYLSQALGYSWDEVHAEADKLEHHISEQFEARIAAALGNPSIDPHGDPIPALDGTIHAANLTFISDLLPNQEATVSRIIDQSGEVLRYLSGLGLTPGTVVKLTSRSPLNDILMLEVAGQTHTVSASVARTVLVQTNQPVAAQPE